jgi:electron transport complex protein RnfG
MEAKAQGYGGDVGVMVGFDVDEGTVAGIAITSMKETPGVGTRVARHSFTSQFSGHPLTGISLRSQGGDIDAVSGATYSSIAAVQATAKAADWYRALEEEIKKTWPAG